MKHLYALAGLLLFFISCKKEEQTVFSGNTIPPYNEIPTLLVENYVNRLFIDLIGREPTDEEMNSNVNALEAGNLAESVRSSLVDELMTSTDYVEGDSSYSHAYSQKFYDDTKARLLEGSSESLLLETYYLFYGNAQLDSLNGNFPGYELNMIEANKISSIMSSRIEWRNGLITVDEMYRRMMFNYLYDQINMNTFNFINASFDNLFYRYPTQAEFDAAFPVIDYNGSGVVFGQVCTNKTEYLMALTTSGEFREGMIRWAYQSLLSREPSSVEVYLLFDEINSNYDIQSVQKSILISDEYAGFDN